MNERLAILKTSFTTRNNVANALCCPARNSDSQKETYSGTMDSACSLRAVLGGEPWLENCKAISSLSDPGAS